MNIINSIKATLYDRVSSPLYGTFVFVWLLSNWKVVYITFFADKVFLESSTRLDWIVEYFAKGTDVFGWAVVYSFFTYAFLFPLIYTAVIILWLPKLLIELDEITLNYKKDRRELKQKIEGERLLSVKESSEIINKNAELEDNFANQLKKYTEQKLDFENRIAAFVANDKANKKINDDLQTRNDLLEKDILKYKDSINKFTESITKFQNRDEIINDFIVKMWSDRKIDFKVEPVIQSIINKGIGSKEYESNYDDDKNKLSFTFSGDDDNKKKDRSLGKLKNNFSNKIAAKKNPTKSPPPPNPGLKNK